jgi:hypothetical protein
MAAKPNSKRRSPNTRPQGEGTRNISYNGPAEELELLHALAIDEALPFAEIMRRIVYKGVQELWPAAVGRLRSIRSEHNRKRAEKRGKARPLDELLRE